MKPSGKIPRDTSTHIFNPLLLKSSHEMFLSNKGLKTRKFFNFIYTI